MVTRRQLLGIAAALPFASGKALAQPTPACGKQTPRQTEGPFFTPSSPLRNSLLEKNSSGKKLLLAGQVLSPDCRPLADAIVDFWHADELGEYDNKGFRYRGHQRTDAQGRYRLETILPGEYPGRARHFHVKVQAPGQKRILTTQLYFPGDRRDSLYRPELEISPSGRFDFIVEA